MVVAFLLEKYIVNIHRTTAVQPMKNYGLVWAPIPQSKRSYAAYRGRSIRDYLIAVDKYIKLMQAQECEYVFIFTDESYVNINHASKFGFVPCDKQKDCNLKRKSGKGRRLIILHAIGEEGPLVDYDDNSSMPIDELSWNRDTPHSKKIPNKYSAELL